jgi:hypothetical protein
MAFSVITNKREHPRFDIHIPCRVETIIRPHPAILRNISASGLQLSGDFALLKELLPNRARALSRQLPTCDIHFEVQTGGIRRPVAVRCQPVYCRRQSHTQISMGCSFIKLLGDSNRYLEQFLRQLQALPL